MGSFNLICFQQAQIILILTSSVAGINCHQLKKIDQ